MLLRSDLDELLAFDKTPAVSVYLPTHSAGREVRQDAIRLRNLLSDAAKRLAAAGRRAPEVDALLTPARRLVDDEEFWRYQGQGLAVLSGPASIGSTNCRSRCRKNSRSPTISASSPCCR